MFALVIICWRMERHTRYVTEFVSDITEISLKVPLNDITVTVTLRLHIFAYNTEKIKIK